MSVISIKKALWWTIAGTRGGTTRAKILLALKGRTANANQLSEEMNLSYKTIRHHLEVLEEHKLLVSEGERYGKLYKLSPFLEADFSSFEEIWQRVQAGVPVKRPPA